MRCPAEENAAEIANSHGLSQLVAMLQSPTDAVADAALCALSAFIEHGLSSVMLTVCNLRRVCRFDS